MNSLKWQMFINVGFADKHSVISPLSSPPPLPYPVSLAFVQFSPRLNSEKPAQNATETHAMQVTSKQVSVFLIRFVGARGSFSRGFHLRSMFLIIFITSSQLSRTQLRSSVDAEFLATRERKNLWWIPDHFFEDSGPRHRLFWWNICSKHFKTTSEIRI